ncbi:hypothetical protein SOASR030_14560 [Leminorella grimontii]|uniref:SMI1/KNR4 family protein n=1 Tax=Leminorella grimontii TaxID=82981 RepID=A0AAV5N105_9GAMM|nr:hypothetical protein [Leminorella grimontii]KFC97303.1 hypothetical protein GLGR_0237 [Leminorella grimontii ATCC 33999 = DSM 5078]GKX55344.1 hypothetical protein SOASR030_14560 [Leminorella grimontii]VFS56512.1 Uncharacterised protein [Leminorella grimontii]
MSFQYETWANLLTNLLRGKGLRFAEGLNEEEAGAVERLFNFRFPPDLKALLQNALPISEGFVDWREGLHSSRAQRRLFGRMKAPLEGFLFDVENNGFWFDGWGDKPSTSSERRACAERAFADYPTMIPVYSHRYLPDSPSEAGNPVFSIHQTDIIYYGYDLASYLAAEFGLPLPKFFHTPEEPKAIVFWDELTS